MAIATGKFSVKEKRIEEQMISVEVSSARVREFGEAREKFFSNSKKKTKVTKVKGWIV